ncbi:MAG: hypothetical protein WAS21_25880 [Geminicoccaceae bacterium]
MATVAMTSRSFARGTGIAGLVGLAAMLCVGSVRADPCTANGNQVPECVVQTDTGSLKGDRSEYMNVYCPTTSPYAWGGWSDSWSSGWHIITRNPIGDNVNSLDFSLSNTSIHTNNWSISIGCSAVNPNGSCTGATKISGDPGCPESNRQTECEPADNCWVTWNEQCINNNVVSNYYCTQVLFETTCFSCESTSQRAGMSTRADAVAPTGEK